MKFWGANVVITGGSSGIGKASAKVLAEKGANVFILARSGYRMAKALREIEGRRQNGRQRFEGFSVDVRNGKRLNRIMKEIVRVYGPPQALICSAGICQPGYFEELSSVFREEMETNFFGTVNAIQAALPYFLDQEQGYIVTISSVAGFLGVFGYTSYGATKFAVRGFSRSLRSELKSRGIRVSVLLPFDVDTPMLEKENRTKPLEAKVVAGALSPRRPGGLTGWVAWILHRIFSGEYEASQPEDVARALVRGMEREKFLIFSETEIKILYHLSHPMDPLVYWVFDQMAQLAPREEG